ncbi:hypothetical protein C8F01DRAFT_41265 [Mycena amicta]|nr:hypothetical protein C8F01DRAFT_41265 [Mycena amicta]
MALATVVLFGPVETTSSGLVEQDSSKARVKQSAFVMHKMVRGWPRAVGLLENTDENSARRITCAVITPLLDVVQAADPTNPDPHHFPDTSRFTDVPRFAEAPPPVVFFSSGRDDVERSRSIRTMLASSRSGFVMHETARGPQGLQNETSGSTGISGPAHFLCNWGDISAWDGFRFLSFRKQPPSSAAKCCIRFHVWDCPFSLSRLYDWSPFVLASTARLWHRRTSLSGTWSASEEEFMTLATTRLSCRCCCMMRRMDMEGLVWSTMQSCVETRQIGERHVLTARLRL